MRLSSGLLLVCASSVFGQVQQLHFKRFTNSSTSAIETPTSSIEVTSSIEATTTSAAASSSASVKLSLRDFTLGQGSSFYPPPDGDSILMSPVPTDGSSLDRRQVPNPAPFTPPNIAINFVRFDIPRFPVFTGPIFLIVNITGSCIGCGKKVKRDVPCVFQVLVDDEVVHEEPITPKSGDINLSTNPFPKKSDYKFTFQQACGNQIVPVILQGVTVKDGPGAVSTPISSVVIGTGSAVETGTATTETATDTNTVGITTNSEGETVTLTESTGTASAASGFTTNSEGETVSLAETTDAASSSVPSFTTNSEGETVFPKTTTSAVSSSAATSVPGFPANILDFTLFGCVGSTAGFPTFTSVETSQRMDLDVCGRLCDGRAYFGVYDTTCYCGDELGDDASRVNLDECNIECPGDDTEFCGGDSSRKLRARQAIPSNRLLTVYAAPQDVIITESVTQIVTEEQTLVTTFTTTVTGASTTAVEAITTTLVCVNGQCFPSASTVYIFVELNGSDCDGQWVFISVPCPDGHKYIPQFCSGGNCASLQVYKPQQCHDWYNYDSFFVASDCSACAQGIQYLPWQNSWGTPDRCNNQVPACTGHNCPSKHQGVAPHGGNWSSNSTVPHGGSSGGSNGGSGGSSSGSNSGSNSSPNGGSNGGSGGAGSGSNPSANGGSSSGSNAAPGSEGAYPSTISVSSASKQAMNMLAFLAVFIALL